MMEGPPTPEEAALEELEWELSAPHSLEEIAARLGLSHASAVMRIEEQALAKMAAILRSEGKGEWEEGLQEPVTLHTRLYECGPTDGRTSARIEDRNSR